MFHYSRKQINTETRNLMTWYVMIHWFNANALLHVKWNWIWCLLMFIECCGLQIIFTYAKNVHMTMSPSFAPTKSHTFCHNTNIFIDSISAQTITKLYNYLTLFWKSLLPRSIMVALGIKHLSFFFRFFSTIFKDCTWAFSLRWARFPYLKKNQFWATYLCHTQSYHNRPGEQWFKKMYFWATLTYIT